LEEADLHPHRSQYWLNPNIDDPVLLSRTADTCFVTRRGGGRRRGRGLVMQRRRPRREAATPDARLEQCAS
jgi:hypothetical protein